MQLDLNSTFKWCSMRDYTEEHTVESTHPPKRDDPQSRLWSVCWVLKPNSRLPCPASCQPRKFRSNLFITFWFFFCLMTDKVRLTEWHNLLGRKYAVVIVKPGFCQRTFNLYRHCTVTICSSPVLSVFCTCQRSVWFSGCNLKRDATMFWCFQRVSYVLLLRGQLQRRLNSIDATGRIASAV